MSKLLKNPSLNQTVTHLEKLSHEISKRKERWDYLKVQLDLECQENMDFIDKSISFEGGEFIRKFSLVDINNLSV